MSGTCHSRRHSRLSLTFVFVLARNTIGIVFIGGILARIRDDIFFAPGSR